VRALAVRQSETNYYGDTHVYLFTTNGKVSKQITVAREGPIHAIGWCTCGAHSLALYHHR
jgi:uncharacterized protein with WD repeat